MNIKDTPIGEFGFSAAVFNSLITYGVKTLEDLYKLTPIEVWKMRRLGLKGIKEISEVMDKYSNIFWKQLEEPHDKTNKKRQERRIQRDERS